MPSSNADVIEIALSRYLVNIINFALNAATKKLKLSECSGQTEN
jgi:hypothetical protein